MGVSHAKVSAIADDPDATLVRPSDWNADHVIAAATVTLAMLANIAAARVIGSVAGGVPAEVTASQLFDFVSTTNGVLLTRSAGSWGAVANIGTDNGDLVANENTTPVAPAAGKTKIFGASHGGRQMLAMLGPTGGKALMQPLIGNRSIATVVGIPTTAAFTVSGFSITHAGTVTVRGVAATNAFTGCRRTGIVSAAGAGSVASQRHAAAFLWRGNAAQAGGFHYVCRFGISDAVIVGTANLFVGVQASTGAPTDVGPETLVNLIGVGCTNGDTQLQLYAADATPRARTALGANFPCNTVSTDLYELALYCPPNGSDVRYQLTRINTGDVATGTISAANNLPLPAALLTHNVYRSNGGTASAVGLDIGSVYIESEN